MITDFIVSNSLEDLLGHRSDFCRKSIFVAGGTEVNRLGSEYKEGEYIALSMEGIGLDTITKVEDGILIGSMVTLQNLIDSEVIPEYLKESAGFAGSRTLRNMATIGGNIASCRDDSYLIPALIAAKSRIHTVDIDTEGNTITEDIPIREYIENFENFKCSCIKEIFLKDQDRAVFVKRYGRTVQRTPDAIIAFGADQKDGRLFDVRIAVGSVGCGIRRLPGIERSVENRDLENGEQCLAAVKKEISPVSSITGSSDYKQYLIAVTIEDMMNKAEGGQKA